MIRSAMLWLAVVGFTAAVVLSMHPCASAQENVAQENLADASPAGQDESVDPEGSSEAGGQVVDASNEEEDPEVDESGVGVAVAPSSGQRVVAGYWTTLAVSGMNRSSEDSEEMVVAMIGDRTNMQFARKMWIPSGSRRTAWLAAQIPDDLSQTEMSIPLRSIHIKQTDRGEEFQNNLLGMPTSERSMLVSWEQSRTGVMLEPKERDYETVAQVERLGNFIYEGRDEAVVEPQDLGLVHLDKGFLPPTARALDPFDQIIIANDSILTDSAAADRIRSWLLSGGRVWIMVDQMKPESIQAIVGDAARFSIVDRVEINEFDHVQRAAIQGNRTEIEPWSSETPAELVRVLADVDDIHSEINGWPTAFWVPVGQGEVLFTTLSSHGWIQDDKPTRTYVNLASRFFIMRLSTKSEALGMETYLDDEIGYNIPSRVSVASVLGLHMLLVLAAGLILAKRKSLHLLAVVVPVAAILATGSLIAMGNQKTSSVPSTIAIGQVARAIPDSSEVRIDSMAAIYSQEERELDIRSSHGTTTTLVEESGGEVKRVVWDDSGESYWMFVQQPPGVVRHVSSQSTVTIPTPWSVQGRFTENGFEGMISGLESARCEDPVIVTSASPSMGVSMVATSGEIRSTGEDVLNPGQFIDSALMSDVQQSRQELLRELIGPETTVVNSNPSLLVWTTPLDAGVEFSKDFQRRGSLLASIPISMQRQGEGAKFLIPPGFVKLEAYQGARGMSTVYNEQTGQWVGTDKASESELRCMLPKVVLPCVLDKATIEIKISAPLRTVEVKGFVDGEFKTLFSRDSPTGLIRYEITDPAALQLDSEGGLLMGIAISATEEELQTQGSTGAAAGPSQDDWQIDYFHVTLQGVTQ